mmetsp:Transcript_24979/g.48793  ORF Transcript_24979/g.48793 Transcript_24979/m.48793 type:complete len:209 (+) Transcript_24979:55-681(+)
MKLMLALASGFAMMMGASAMETKVNVYEGPTECEDADKIKSGSYVSIHYTGKIDESSAAGEGGSEFDSSRSRGDPFSFRAGEGQVIKGWDEGLVGLCTGAKATLVIPPAEGYGERGAGGAIPGGATLNFDVEVMGVSDQAPPEPNLFEELDTDTDGKLSKAEVLVYFEKYGDGKIPEGMWEHEDADSDGFISWEEFSGPKGESAKDEL